MRANDSTPPGDLRALLEEPPYIDDAGFTDRVVHALPQRRRPSAVRYAVVPAFTALACELAFVLSGGALTGTMTGQAGHLALPASMIGSFLALAFALLLLASATLLPADD